MVKALHVLSVKNQNDFLARPRLHRSTAAPHPCPSIWDSGCSVPGTWSARKKTGGELPTVIVLGGLGRSPQFFLWTKPCPHNPIPLKNHQGFQKPTNTITVGWATKRGNSLSRCFSLFVAEALGNRKNLSHQKWQCCKHREQSPKFLDHRSTWCQVQKKKHINRKWMKILCGHKKNSEANPTTQAHLSTGKQHLLIGICLGPSTRAFRHGYLVVAKS